MTVRPRLFPQCAVVLFDTLPTLDALKQALGPFEIVRTIEPSEVPWLGGHGVLLAMRREVNGYVLVEIHPQPWPDHMGDPTEDVEVFGAWALGYFGPGAFPFGLQRAVQQAHHLDKGVAAAAERHRAFVRILVSYALGKPESAPIAPDDRDALAELQFVTDVARAVTAIAGATFYFNPNGETLYPPDALAETLAHHAAESLMPLPVWANVRMFKADASGWLLMDTVGMSQLDVDDHEACVPPDGIDLGEVSNFLRNTTAYVFDSGPVIDEGNTIDGPGGVWQAHLDEASIGLPERPALRWRLRDGQPPPEGFRFPVEKKRGWKFWK